MKIFLMFLFLVNISFSSEIRGKIYNKASGEYLTYVSAGLAKYADYYDMSLEEILNYKPEILQLTRGNNENSFVFKNIKKGRYTLIINAMGYNYSDTIDVFSDSIIINKTMFVNSYNFLKIKSDSTTEDYHRSFSKYKAEEILDIHIDSLKFNTIVDNNKYFKNYSLTTFSTITNKSDSIVYIIYEPNIKLYPKFINFLCGKNDSLLNYINTDKIFSSRDINFSSNVNILKLLPKTSCKFIPISINNFDVISEGLNKLYLSYSFNFEEENRLYDNFENISYARQVYYDQIEMRKKGLRGVYKSSNFISISKHGEMIVILNY